MLGSALLSLPALALAALFIAPSAVASSNFTERTSTPSNWQTETCANVAGSYLGYNYNFGCLCYSDVSTYCSNNNINSYISSLLESYIQEHGSTNSYPPNAQPTCSNGGYTCGSLTKNSDGTCSSTGCPSNTCSTNGGCCPKGQTYTNGKCCGSTGCSHSGTTCTPVLSCNTYQSNSICCPSGTSGWTGYKTVCCPSGQSESSSSPGTCVCPNGQKVSSSDSTKCVSSCPYSGWTYYNTQCCPPNSIETGGKCVCNSNQQSITGSGSSAACTNKCTGSQSSWTFCNTICCPSGTSEVSGKCVCNNNQQTYSNGQCANRCTGSQSGWTFYNTQCCPAGTQENSSNKCQCTNTQTQLVNNQCVAKCTGSQSGWTFCQTQCCPSGSSEVSGKCVCNSSNQQLSCTNSGSCTCTNKCNPGYSFCQTQCCKSYMTESGGSCVCSQTGYYDNGSACAPKCDSGYTYNTATKACDPICDYSHGYTYQTGWGGNGMCCLQGYTACNTVCCPAYQEEIGTSGKCCPIGSTLSNGQCVSPTGKSGTKKRAPLQLPMVGTDIFGLDANREHKLCPTGLAACPIPGRTESEYECLDSLNDLTSCGGCTSMGTGQDCTAIKGAKWMGCNMGTCEVYSCRAGFRKVNDTSCEKVSRR